MPALNQNITIFDKDEITIRFNVTDAEAGLSSGLAWWGVGDSATDTGTLFIEKSSGTWNNGGQSSTVPAGDSSEIQIGSVFINCYITGSDYGTDITADDTYYHELVYAGTGLQDASNVVANGSVTVKPSIFTLLGYR